MFPIGQRYNLQSVKIRLVRSSGQLLQDAKFVQEALDNKSEVVIGEVKDPEGITCDDLEDDEGVENEERREKLKKWFFSALMNSVDTASDNWRVGVFWNYLT